MTKMLKNILRMLQEERDKDRLLEVMRGEESIYSDSNGTPYILRMLLEEMDKEAGVYFDGVHYNPDLDEQKILGKRYMVTGYNLWLGADEKTKYKIYLEQECRNAK